MSQKDNKDHPSVPQSDEKNRHKKQTVAIDIGKLQMIATAFGVTAGYVAFLVVSTMTTYVLGLTPMGPLRSGIFA